MSCIHYIMAATRKPPAKVLLSIALDLEYLPQKEWQIMSPVDREQTRALAALADIRQHHTQTHMPGPDPRIVLYP
jgi:hypothetical protein